MIKRLCSTFLLYSINIRTMCFSQACFKRRATADCSSTAAPGHYHDLVSDVELRKQNSKIKEQFSKLLNVLLGNVFIIYELSSARQ